MKKSNLVYVGEMDLNTKIFDFYYELAFRDATMRKSFKRREEEKEDYTEFKERKDRVKKAAKDIVKNYICLIMSGECGEDTTENTIIAVSKETSKDGFTFGNAQKLVNMTAKYFYLVCYNNKKIRKNFRYCHCPMDSRMIHVAIDKYSNKGTLSVKREMSWSMLELNDENEEDVVPKEYQEFQQIIKEIGDSNQIYQLEVDYQYW